MEKNLIHYLGLSKGTYSQWRIGNGRSYLKYIKEICAYFHVSPNYLFLGNKEAELYIYEEHFSKEELNIIEKYREMNAKEKKYFRAILDAFVEVKDQDSSE